jgi:hypothetical protein
MEAEATPTFPSFVSNKPSHPKIVISCDRTLKVIFLQLCNTMGLPVQYVGKLHRENDVLDKNGIKYVGFKKDETGHAISMINGSYTNFQHIFVYPYGHLNGPFDQIVNQSALIFKQVNIIHQ